MGRERFRRIFQSITADNGGEFLNCEAVERANRTRLYYAHAYAAWERGSNENINRMIRRFLPKGSALSRVNSSVVEQIEEWINPYPRRIHGFKTAEEMFIEELAA